MSDVQFTTTHPVAQCVDLRATFAGQFRFAWDAAYATERSDLRRIEAPWLTIIPCRYGKIFPWGGRLLAAYTTTRRRRLAMLPGLTIVQGSDGSDGCPEVIVTFDVNLIQSVADLLGARLPRAPVSDEQRQAFIARTKSSQFRPRNDDPFSDQGKHRP